MLHSPRCTGSADDLARLRKALLATPTPPPLAQLLSDVVTRLHCSCLDVVLQTSHVSTAELNEALSLAKRNSNDGERHIAVMRSLLAAGASANHVADNVVSTDWLFLALDNDYVNELRLLLQHGALTEDQSVLADGSLQRVDEGRISPLTHAISHCNTAALRLLLLHKASMRVNFGYYVHGFTAYSIPHFILYNYYDSEEALEALHTYHEFGGSLWSLDRLGYPYFNMMMDSEEHVDEETAVEAIRNRPGLKHHLGIVTALERMMRNPRSLMCLARGLIRLSMGRHYWRQLQHLHVPTELKLFLSHGEASPLF